MNVAGKVAVVTGGAGGIGVALARRLTDAGARVVVADRDAADEAAVAERVGGAAAHGDVSRAEVDIFALAESRFGPVDLFFANAGVGGEPGIGDSHEGWQHAIDVNVLAHVRAARLLVPGWLARGSGYFVATASAAGLLTQIGGAPYSVTKHAAVAFSEWLSVTYGDRGIGVSCLCPMGVSTNMLNDGLDAADQASQLGATVVAHAGAVLQPDDVAQCVLDAVEQERFLVLPHPEVLGYFRRKASDYDRWLRGMRRLQMGGVRPMRERTALLDDFGGVQTTNVHDAFRAFSSQIGDDPELVLRLLSRDPGSSRLLAGNECGRLDDESFEHGFAARLAAHGVRVSPEAC